MKRQAEGKVKTAPLKLEREKGNSRQDMKNTKKTAGSQPQDAWDYYRAKGFSVFPVTQNKKPVVKWKIFQTRHATDAEVAEWKKRGFNIAIATGALSDLMVVDEDSVEARRELERLNPDGIKMPTVDTPRGGKHYYGKPSSSLWKNLVGVGKSKKIDLKTEGGYVLAPPSVTKDGKYGWVTEQDLDTIPMTVFPKRWEYLLLHARLSGELRGKIEPGPKLVEGSRDVDIFRMAGAMRREGWTRKQAEEMAVTMAEKARLKPSTHPFTNQDALDKVKSAWERPLRDRYRRVGGEGELLFRPLSAYERREIEWLWYNRIPLGSYSAIGGDPGEGKSIALVDIFAKITRGRPLADNRGEDPSGSVIYIVAEDNMCDTVRGRAEDAGADLEKFIVSSGAKPGGGFFSITNPDDLAELEEQIIALGDVRGIGLDPITTFMAELNAYKEVEVRAALAPLNNLAEKHNVAILGVGHLNKDEQKKALYRLSGSIAFVSVARTVWVVKKDEEMMRGRRFFSPLKHNILKDPTSLAFTISGPLGHPVITWEDDPVNVDVADLLGDEDSRERASALTSARIFLDDLVPVGEEKLQADIISEGRAQGHKERTLRRAKDQLGGFTAFQRERQWYWRRRIA